MILTGTVRVRSLEYVPVQVQQAATSRGKNCASGARREDEFGRRQALHLPKIRTTHP
jgi:hypothetical protein